MAVRHARLCAPVPLSGAARRALLVLLAVAAALAAAPAPASAHPTLVVLSGGAHVQAGQTVGDVVSADGPVVVDGQVTGNVVSIGGPARIRGVVDGDVATLSDRATLLPGARVHGDLRYGDRRPVVAPGAHVDGTIRHESWSGAGGAPWGVIGRLAFWLAVSVSTLALGLFLLWLAPGTAARAVEVFRRRSAQVALTGLVLFIGLPVLAVLAIATLVGLPLGITALLALVPLAAIGYVTGAHLLGRVVAPNARPVAAFLAGWGILRAAALVPWGGGLLGAVAVALGLGALVLAGWEARAAGRRPDAPSAAGGMPERVAAP